MLPVRIDHSQIREKILGESMRSVAADLRLIDLPDIVSYLKTGQIASVRRVTVRRRDSRAR